MIWEQIDGYHRRAKVFGGWLVKAYEETCHIDAVEAGYQSPYGHDLRIAMCFVPDPNHEWKLEVKP